MPIYWIFAKYQELVLVHSLVHVIYEAYIEVFLESKSNFDNFIPSISSA